MHRLLLMVLMLVALASVAVADTARAPVPADDPVEAPVTDVLIVPTPAGPIVIAGRWGDWLRQCPIFDWDDPQPVLVSKIYLHTHPILH